MTLDLQAKKKVYSRVCELVTQKHFDPGMNGANWEELSKTRKDQILRSSTDEEFEKQVQGLAERIEDKSHRVSPLEEPEYSWTPCHCRHIYALQFRR